MQPNPTTTSVNSDERRGCTSASNAHADLLCPGRHLAQKAIPPTDEPLSADAEFGRTIHAALAFEERGLARELQGQQRDIFDACREVEKQIITQWFGEDHEKMRVFREKRFWCKVPPEMYEHSAKPDVVLRAGKRGLVIEYKTLPGDVPESPTNLQLRDQIVLAARTLFMEPVGAVVIQPLVTMKPTITEYSADAIKQAEQELWERVRKSNDPAAIRLPGDVQCKFCTARFTCPQYHAYIGSQVPVAKTILEVPMADWSPAQCAIFCSGRAAARKWLDEAEAMIKARLKANPEEIPGWGLKEGKSRRKITDPQRLYDRFQAEGGELSRFMATISVGIEKLKEELRAVSGLKGKQLQQKLDSLLEGLVWTTQDEPSITKTSITEPQQKS